MYSITMLFIFKKAFGSW